MGDSPQMSAPVKEMPTSPGATTAGTCHLRSCHVDAESPVQCAVYAPEPTNVDLGKQTKNSSLYARNLSHQADHGERMQTCWHYHNACV